MHVEVSLSKILNPKLLLMGGWHLACTSAISVMSWGLIQGVPCPETAGIGSSKSHLLQPIDGWMGILAQVETTLKANNYLLEYLLRCARVSIKML